MHFVTCIINTSRPSPQFDRLWAPYIATREIPYLAYTLFVQVQRMAAPNKPPRPAEVCEVITICMRYCRFHKTFPFLSSAEKLWNTFGAAGEARRSSRAIHTVLKWPHPSFLTTTYRSAKTSPSCKISTHGRGDLSLIHISEPTRPY